MVRKLAYSLFLMPLMVVYMSQPVFAGFDVVVVNESEITYNVDLDIRGIEYNAWPGRIALGEVKPGESIFHLQYEYLKFPLTGLDMPPSLAECNLNMMVVASSQHGSEEMLVSTFKNIIQPPQIKDTIIEEEPRKFPSKQPMKGIKPPSIKIIIKGPTSECPNSKIEAEFNGVLHPRAND